MSRPSDLALKTLNSQLSEVEQLIADKQTLMDGEPRSFAYELSLTSLLSLKYQLLKEKQDLLGELGYEELDVRLHGDTVATGMAAIKTVSLVLTTIQTLISEIAQAVGKGIGSRGKLTNEVLDTTQLRLHQIYEGPVGFKLLSPKHQLELYPQNDTMHESLVILFDLLDASDNPDVILRYAKEIGSRTFNTLIEFVDTLKENDLELTLHWQSFYKKQRQWAGTKTRLTELSEALSEIEELEVSQEELDGLILEASAIKGTFKFNISETGEIIAGTFNEAIREQIADVYDKRPIKGYFEKTVLRAMKSQKTRTFWVLQHLE
ncbi:hypothetical protein [Brevibacillus dissolubilis]|uniref:hypothetical protein n=1 Tax=Brevibacillus dissolubilis TaxID=1844116 RepID=UPI001117A5D0|nr:hypothetical protein [Brevibacillus dissolubilis]